MASFISPMESGVPNRIACLFPVSLPSFAAPHRGAPRVIDALRLAQGSRMARATLRELHEELQLCQRRLGTLREVPDDFERVLKLAHEINNRLTVEVMRDFDGQQTPSRLSFTALLKRYFR
jgi:hypothetical protein